MDTVYRRDKTKDTIIIYIIKFTLNYNNTLKVFVKYQSIIIVFKQINKQKIFSKIV